MAAANWKLQLEILAAGRFADRSVFPVFACKSAARAAHAWFDLDRNLLGRASAKDAPSPCQNLTGKASAILP